MHPFPHVYQVRVAAVPAGPVALDSPGLASLASDGPREFDGPGDLWSPETLLTGAVADCFVLSFRAVATASRFAWTSLHCEAEGTLDRVERVTQFTGFVLRARLVLPPGADAERARKLLEKAEQVCLISRSLKGPCHLEADIQVG